MEAFKKQGWKVLVGIGILCLLIAGVLAYTNMTARPAVDSSSSTADVEHGEPSEKTGGGSTIRLPEV